MRKWFILMVTLLSILFTGCTVEANRIYTICRIKDGITYVYNGDGEFFTYRDGKVNKCYPADLQTKPAIPLVLTDNFDYSINYEMPTVYHGTKHDALCYLSFLLKKDDGKYTVISVDWKSFEILATCSEYTIRIIYTDDDTIRLYMQDGSAPPYIY